MRLLDLTIATLLLGGTACLGSYSPPPGSQGNQPAPPGSPAPPTGNSGSGNHPPPSAPADGGTALDGGGGTATPSPKPDGGASGGSPGSPGQPQGASCTALGNCCDLLPTSDAANCNAALAGASDAVCQGILAQLQQNGVCP